MSLDKLLDICAVDEHCSSNSDGRHRQPSGRTGWLWLVDRVLGDWPRTLRASLLCGLLLIALVVILAILVGVKPALTVAGLYVLHRLIVRQQVRRTQMA